MIYIITGKLGSGKSLLAVQVAIDYAAAGRRTAANFHIDLAPACINPDRPISKQAVTVLSPIPTINELMMLGNGGDFEDTAGGLFLDECAQFLNARNWQGPERELLINWLLHARKRCWDVFIIVQHERMLDKQVRDALAEYVVTVKRTDRIKFPFLPVKIPRMHIGTVRYGLDPNAMIADRWITRGALPMKCYDTRQIFSDESAPYTVLPATYTKFRNYEKSTIFTKLRSLVARPVSVNKESSPPPIVEYLRSLPHHEAMEKYRVWERVYHHDPDLAAQFIMPGATLSASNPLH